MDLQPSGDNNELCYIETEEFFISIKTNRDISHFGDNKTFIYSCNGIIGTSPNIDNVYLNEYSDYEIIIENKGNKNIEFYHESPLIRNKITPTGRSRKILSGIINFKGDIGKSDFVINVNGREYLVITIEVYPTKIDYKEDYEAILRDVNEEVYNLAYEFLKRTYLNTTINNRNTNSLTEFHSILKYVYKRLLESVKIILNNPHHQLMEHKKIVKQHRLKNAHKDTIKWLEKRPNKVIKNNNSYIPIEGLQVTKEVTLDTNENRFLKYILMDICKKISEFIKRYSKLFRETDTEIIRELEEINNKIKSLVNSTFLRNVGLYNLNSSISLVFTMGNGYREVYKYYLMLRKGLSINSHIFALSMKELSTLYEYWCFIKINSLLKKKYKLISSDLLKVNRNGIFLTLKKGKTANMKYKNPLTGEEFTISYNPKKSSKTIAQKPDNILSIEKKGSNIAYEFVFDAKYKIETSERYVKTYGGIGPKEEDINTMHRYRDAIIYENKNSSSFENTIFGAFVLFPYREEEEFKNQRFYKSIDEVNVGGLPFLPSTTKLMEEFLDELIKESPYSTLERGIHNINEHLNLKEEYFTNRNVLVGTLRNKEQFVVNFDHKFYHTKASNVNLVENKVEYVALAQSKNHFKEEAGILYYGKVKDIKIIKRNEIKEIPSSSEEVYYRFEIEEWKALSDKIKVKGYNIRSIMYTSEYLLHNSDIVTDLCIKSSSEFRLWRELKRLSNDVESLASNKSVDKDSRINGFIYDGCEIYIIGDTIKIRKDNKELEYSMKTLKDSPRKIISSIVNRNTPQV